jgi:glycosyltransferase involved in cell wall biosynthesis
MIVKNEAPVIARCLASSRPIIDYWVIVDTGSTDGTQDKIWTLMADLPGELHERPWRDFAHNRTEALELSRSHGEYVLVIDADDELEFEPQFKMPTLQDDSYMLRITDTSVRYNRTQIVRAVLPWRWRGVLHEFLTCEDARSSSGILEGLRLRRNHDGARRRDPQTYRHDVEILKAALQTERDPFMRSRYEFYLAQSYRDCGEKGKALQAYLRRAELGFWAEEVFMSLYSAAKLQEALGQPFDEVIATYLRAAATIPSRAEALYGASRYCRLSARYKEGYEIAKRAGLFRDTPEGLFVEPWIYEYGLLDEFAVNAYWVGAYQECLDACERILREGKCPEAQRPRIEANAAFARQKLGIGDVAAAGPQ